MDIRDILKSFDQLTEGDSTVHKAGPGGYGNRHGTDDVTDQYGKPIGRTSLAKMNDAPAVKRGKGRPPKNADSSGEVKSYDSSALSKAMGMGKAPKPKGKPSVKHSLKEYFDQMDGALSEAGLAVQPMPATPAVKAQQQMATKPSFMIKDPANPNMPAITTQDPAVVQAAKNGTMSMQKPGAAPTTQPVPGATPAAGAGSQVKPMGEGGDVGKHNNATTGFDALVRKLTPKYGKEAATKIAGSQFQKMKEAEAPQYFAQSSPLSSNNRGVLESKKGVNPFAKKEETDKKKCPPMSHVKKMCQDGKSVAEICKMHPDCDQKELKQMVADCKKKLSEGAKPDFLDIDKDGNKKEPMKKAAADKNKGAAPKKGVNPFAKKKVKEGMEHNLQAARLQGKSHALRKMPYNCTNDDMEEARHYHDGFKEGLDECYGQMPILGRTAVGEMGQGPEVATMASYGADDMGEAMYDEGNAFTAGLAKTPHGGKFKVGGSSFTDNSRYDSNLDEFAFEALDKQLNAILEDKKVSEGMTVSISKGQQGSPDSVSVSAQDGEADQLLSIIKSAGMGLFGGDEQNGYGAPQGSAGAHGGISVVDDHDGMMALMKKLSGNGEMQGGGDYEDEEGSSEEGHMHGEEETCESCGGMMEENHQCDSGEQSVMGEDESEDQMAYEVAETNAPDSGADNTNADVAGNAAANSALATADAGQDEEEGQVYSSPTEGMEDTTGEEAGTDALDEEGYYKDPDGDDESAEDQEDKKDNEKRRREEETVAESFANLYKKLAYLSEESTSEKDAKAEKAGKKVAKDIEYDEGHKGKDDNKAEKAGKKVTKDIEYDDKKDKKVDESYANSADDTFEADIDFMTKVITGGLNKQKSTGQTTIPVIAGQRNRMGADGLGSPMKESTDLLKDYMKLSGL